MMNLIAIVYGFAFIMIGIAHFREPDKFVEIVPAILPFPLFLVYLSGGMEIAGGMAIIYPETRVLAGRLLALFLIGVYPANLYMCCLLYTSPSPRDLSTSRMPSSA